MASQQLVSSFVIQGYSFVEMLLRDSVYIDSNEGEFLLSREVADLSTEHNAPVVLVGTYAVADDNIYVTAKLIRTADNVIVASYDYAVPYTRDIRTLLRPVR
jgi:TolB-like protein